MPFNSYRRVELETHYIKEDENKEDSSVWTLVYSHSEMMHRH